MLPTLLGFLGASGASKPTACEDGSPLPAGASFHEQDTGDLWLWDGSRWHYQRQGRFAVKDATATFLAGLDVAGQKISDQFRLFKTEYQGQSFTPPG